MATRRIGAATFDHGAQFFTVRTPAFGRRVDDWSERGLVSVWNHGFAHDDGHPRYVAPGGMTSLAKDLASGLDVAVLDDGVHVAATIRSRRRLAWDVVIDDGTTRPADHVIVTTPLAQAFGLLADSDLDPRHRGVPHRLRPHDLPARRARPAGPRRTRAVASSRPTVCSASSATTCRRVSAPCRRSRSTPTRRGARRTGTTTSSRSARRSPTAAEPWLGDATIVEHQVKKWRFATPRTISPDPCWTSPDRSVILAGDAFAGPRIEGAHNSGLAAAHTLLG